MNGTPTRRLFDRTRSRPALTLLLAVSAFFYLTAEEPSEAKTFRYAFRVGEEYRIVGINQQQLVVDGEVIGEAEVLTRVLVETVDSQAGSEGEVFGTLRAEYQVSEEATTDSGVFELDRTYDVELRQNALGEQEVPPESFVPQVRDVPVFPSKPISPGDTWTHRAAEAYDFRESLGITSPVIVPVDAQYEYLGEREFENERYDAFRIRYNVFYRPPPTRPEAEAIRLLTARFTQDLLWNYRAGRPHYYDERYNLFIQLADGTRSEYRGVADGRVVYATPLDRERLQRDIEDAIRADDMRDMSVRSDEEGVTVSLENIQFAPDSAELLESEKEKLRWLAQILERYPERDVLVSGHTALAGTASGRQRLSEERADAVGRFLIELGVRTRENVMFRGYGARSPIADNETEAGRRRNRRVEITILEN